MTKRISTPEPEETVTIPKSSFDNIFRAMEDMKQEIADLRAVIAGVEKADRVFNIKEAAEYCGVSRWTILNRIKAKKLHKVERGGKVGILKSELDKAAEL